MVIKTGQKISYKTKTASHMMHYTICTYALSAYTLCTYALCFNPYVIQTGGKNRIKQKLHPIWCTIQYALMHCLRIHYVLMHCFNPYVIQTGGKNRIKQKLHPIWCTIQYALIHYVLNNVVYELYKVILSFIIGVRYVIKAATVEFMKCPTSHTSFFG